MRPGWTELPFKECSCGGNPDCHWCRGEGWVTDYRALAPTAEKGE